jgi:cyclophilin family peptidyl-prolyl cis-trans isomerase
MRHILVMLICSFCLVPAFAKNKTLKIETNYGVILLKLYDNTPLHSANLIKLCREHYFDSTLFHRVIPSFVIQGGDPDSKHAGPDKQLGDGDLNYLVPAEINAVNYHKRGALGMARDNNPEKKSSACQFYIVVGKVVTEEQLNTISSKTNRVFTTEQRKVYTTLGGTPFLDGNYTVFGEVIKGMDVVDTIAMLSRNAADRPFEDVRMLKVRVLRNKFLGIF